MSADAIEAEIQAKGLTAPRVTPADIEAAITSEHYFTAADGARFLWLTADHSDVVQRDAVDSIGCGLRSRSYAATCQDIDANSNGVVIPTLGLLTFCVLVLRNGFTVTGQSACASPENFDAEVGRKIARQDAIRQVWPLLGYELRSKLAARPADYRDRVRQERAELDEKRMALAAFFGTDRFASLPGAEQQRMRDQLDAMRQYSAVLQERIEAFDNSSGKVAT